MASQSQLFGRAFLIRHNPRLACGALAFLVMANPATADALLDTLLTTHIQPGFTTLATASANLSQAAQDDCTPDSEALQSAFADAWDAWISVSHLRFGPTETENRAFALGLWPDKHGAVPKTLAKLIAEEDASVGDPDAFAEVSIAARGFTALEFLLYDDTLSAPSEYHCALVRAIASDIQRTADAMAEDWTGEYGAAFAGAGGEGSSQTVAEAQAEVLTSGLTALAFTKDARIGLPMGSDERPRPKRAEARRSGRSLQHVELSLDATGALAAIMAAGLDGEDSVTAAFATASDTAEALDDPVFEGVSTAEGRAALDELAAAMVTAEHSFRDVVVPGRNLTEGFNALDGD